MKSDPNSCFPDFLRDKVEVGAGKLESKKYQQNRGLRGLHGYNKKGTTKGNGSEGTDIGVIRVISG